jgi:hypothetical protein
MPGQKEFGHSGEFSWSWEFSETQVRQYVTDLSPITGQGGAIA